MIIVAALIVAAAVLVAASQVRSVLQASRADATRARSLELAALFAPAMAAAATDPRALLVWQPLAQMARRMLPDEFALIDRAAGGVFPFSNDRLQTAHAQWTTDWLGWERSHDSEYKLKAAAIEQEITASGSSPLRRAQLDAVEREKLDLYQRRYQEYVQVSKALQALTAGPP